ncbi:Protein phosphatase 2C 2 [Dimargaris verticillata]|uniref:protein-serine/threonine phosphatase n=1 Tax=Dimargaris verticillata TaxID=2761393 RepID=A0A9W8EB82_9FUNG|nr:Protein phosphatase 2C 2 [Dimargaris verticillata]
MGQTLSEPVVEKHTEKGGDKRVIFAVSSMQGWRLSMEDAHATVLNVQDNDNNDTGSAFFGVYDGHGGVNSATFSGQSLHKHIVRTDAFKQGDFETAIRQGFLEADEELRRVEEASQSDYSGCTAICVLMTPDNTLFVGNAGDSRAILGSAGKSIALSTDHKPTLQQECDRILAAGGFIEFGRVNGNLALSRAIGDFEFKQNKELPPEKQVVTACPDVLRHTITEDDEFVVVACDGIWDCMESQKVIDYVGDHLAQGQTLDEICETIMDDCLAPAIDTTGVGCDNMTIAIVGLLHGRTEAEWYQWVGERYRGRVAPDSASSSPKMQPSQDSMAAALPAVAIAQAGEVMASEAAQEGEEQAQSTAVSNAPSAPDTEATQADSDASKATPKQPEST